MLKKTHKQYSSIAKVMLLLGAGLIVTGCSTASQYSGQENQKRNLVEMVRIPYVMAFAAEKAMLSPDELSALDRFLTRASVGYGDELSMDFALERDGKITPLNTERLEYIREILIQRGLNMSYELTPYGRAPAQNTARLLISRYVVTPPQCGDWSQPSTPNYNNALMKDHGCSTQAQLGLMVANPKDLITGVSSDQTDTEKAAKAINTYRTRVTKVGTATTAGGKK